MSVESAAAATDLPKKRSFIPQALHIVFTVSYVSETKAFVEGCLASGRSSAAVVSVEVSKGRVSSNRLTGRKWVLYYTKSSP